MSDSGSSTTPSIAPTERPVEAPQRSRSRTIRGQTIQLRHELLAPLETMLELSSELLATANDRPEEFVTELRDLRDACLAASAFVRQRLAFEVVPADREELTPWLGRFAHDFKSHRLNHISTHCQFALSLVKGAFLDGYCDDLTVIHHYCRQYPDLAVMATFFELPPAPVPEPPDPSELGTAHGVILVVDDDDVSRTTMIKWLSKLGHDVVGAASGDAAIGQLWDREDWSLVLLDIQMQGKNGFDVLKAMKSNNVTGEIPVVMISGISQIDSIAKALNMGANDYLPKPVDFRLLQARVNSCLAQVDLKQRQKDLVEVIKDERKRANDVLQQIFPFHVVQELKATGAVMPQRFFDVAVMFCDVQGFTTYCDQHEPGDVLAKLQTLFEEYERICDRLKVEKIKTVGDCFIATAGLHNPSDNPVLDLLRVGQRMIEMAPRLCGWQVRAGIHCGPLIGGLVGKRQYAFDLLGDTMNTAARVQGAAAEESVFLTAAAWNPVNQYCVGESLGVKELKNKSPLEIHKFVRFRKKYAEEFEKFWQE